jgi:soluble lytic murein transglycosylase-like protein
MKSLKHIVLAVAVSAMGWSQTPADPPQSAQSGMAASLEKQRASVMKQVSAVTGKPSAPAASFFTVPWIDTLPPIAMQVAAPVSVPPCDPLPGDQLDKLIDESSKQEGVKSDLIRAVIGQESGGRPCAVSSKGAQGLMQLMPATAAQFGVIDPFNPKQNVDAGAKLLKQLLAKYSGDISLALSAYNAGSDRVDKDGGVPAIPETVSYVTDIMAKLPKQ